MCTTVEAENRVLKAMLCLCCKSVHLPILDGKRLIFMSWVAFGVTYLLVAGAFIAAMAKVHVLIHEQGQLIGQRLSHRDPSTWCIGLGFGNCVSGGVSDLSYRVWSTFGASRRDRHTNVHTV